METYSDYNNAKEKSEQFMKLVNLIAFLVTSESKEYKKDAIKTARADGVISADEAIDLAIEFF